MTLRITAACAAILVSSFLATASCSLTKEYGYFFPFGKDYDYVLVDPPDYVFAEGDEDLGLFYHPLNGYMPVFHNEHTRELFISTNGYVSFDKPLFTNNAEPFPAPSPILNIYHGDLRFTDDEKSHLSFQEYSHYKNPNMMYRAKFEIETFAHISGFNPTLVVVITWNNAKKVIGGGKATFQLVLATDEWNTYAIMNYKDLYLEEPHYEFCPITIGWQEDEGKHNFYQHPNMQLSANDGNGEYRPIKMQYESNVHIPGKWIYHIYQKKVEDPSTTIKPSITPTPAPLPAKCPEKEFCHHKPQLAAWPGYPEHFVVCAGVVDPVCMACPAKTVFSSLCGICVHPFQLDKECPSPPPVKENKFEESKICNHKDATRICKMKKNPFGRYRNYNDITGVTFYQCAGIYGSWCRPCAPGTVFRQYQHNRNEGLCVHKNEAYNGLWN